MPNPERAAIHIDTAIPPHGDTTVHVDVPAGGHTDTGGQHIDVRPQAGPDKGPHVDAALPHIDVKVPPHVDTKHHIDTPAGPHADASLPELGPKA